MSKYKPNSNRRCLWLSEQSLEILAGAASLSRTINASLEHLEWLVQQSMPGFTRDEWCAIMDANNGAIMDGYGDVSGGYGWTWANVADSPGIGDVWSVDTAELIRKMKAMTPAEQISHVAAIDVFWRWCSLPTDEALWLATRGKVGTPVAEKPKTELPED